MSDTAQTIDQKPIMPKVSRPEIPDGYGIPKDNKGLLPWSHVEERLTPAINYWVCTVRPDGRPHVTPVWGAWLDGKMYIEGSPETRRAKNLHTNPAVSVHLESGSDVVILEGIAREVEKPERELGEKLSKAMTAKYKSMGYEPGPDNWDQGGLIEITVKTVLAWSRFPTDTTRFSFE